MDFIRGLVDERADGLDLYRPRWIGAERDVLPSEPGVEELPGHDDRHAVMEFLDGVVCGGREDRAGLERVARRELGEWSLEGQAFRDRSARRPCNQAACELA